MFPMKYYLIDDWRKFSVLGVEGLYSSHRIDGSSLPEGFYKYSLREGMDDFYSSVGESVLFNYVGDFVCKEKFDFNEDGEKELDGEYVISKEFVNPDEFFGVDTRQLIAEQIDRLYFESDPEGYKLSRAPDETREDVVLQIKEALDDKEWVSEVIDEIQIILDEQDYFSEKQIADTYSLIKALNAINNKNRYSLNTHIRLADDKKNLEAMPAQQ